MNSKKAPEIRFKGFTDDWEQRKFSEIAQRESTAKKSSTDFPSVEYEDVVSEVGILNKDVRLKETQKTGICFDGSQVLYGKLRPYLHNWLSPDFSGVAVGDWWVLKPVNVDKSFLFRLIQTEKFDDIANQSSGSKMPRADWNLLSNTEFMVPAEIEEERKIGQYFSELDHLITLHQSKAKLWNFVRFSRSPISWEQRKLGDIYTERNEPGNANLPILSVSIHSGVSDGELSEDDLGKNVRRSEDKTTYKHVYDGDLIFNMMRAWQGAIGVAKGEGMISPAYISAIPNDEVYPPFMDFLLKRADIINQINNLSYGVTDFRKRLYWDSFVRVKCMLPSVDEQKKIANTFIKLDRAIALHQRKKRYIEYYRNRGIFYAWI